MPNPHKFLYFDLGNVLLFFDHHLAARQLAALTDWSAERVYEFLFVGDLNERCDAGRVDAAEFCRLYREATGCSADDEAILDAARRIFRVNPPMKAILCQLQAAGHRVGMLSNTCDMHYDYFADGRYRPIPEIFDAVVLSYRLKLVKPGREIYLKATEMAGVEPQEIFYVDDKPENVDGALQAGWDAVQFTTPAAYAADLRRRSVKFNY